MANEPLELSCPPFSSYRVEVTIAVLNTEIALLFARDGKLEIGRGWRW